MACIIEYSCKKNEIGTLVFHNIKINNVEWHYPGSENPPLSEDEIKSLVASASCDEGELTTLGFVKGWIRSCD